MKFSKFTPFLSQLGAVAIIFSLVACFGGGGKKCSGTIQHQGKSFVSQAKNETDAGKFACNKYCIEVDPEVDARYNIWLSSPKGKAAGLPPKTKAMYEDKSFLDYVTITCANKCLGMAKVGEIDLKVSCQ